VGRGIFKTWFQQLACTSNLCLPLVFVVMVDIEWVVTMFKELTSHLVGYCCACHPNWRCLFNLPSSLFVDFVGQECLFLVLLEG
jgi:hypothetical protein